MSQARVCTRTRRRKDSAARKPYRLKERQQQQQQKRLRTRKPYNLKEHQQQQQQQQQQQSTGWGRADRTLGTDGRPPESRRASAPLLHRPFFRENTKNNPEKKKHERGHAFPPPPSTPPRGPRRGAKVLAYSSPIDFHVRRQTSPPPIFRVFHARPLSASADPQTFTWSSFRVFYARRSTPR